MIEISQNQPGKIQRTLSDFPMSMFPRSLFKKSLGGSNEGSSQDGGWGITRRFWANGGQEELHAYYLLHVQLTVLKWDLQKWSPNTRASLHYHLGTQTTPSAKTKPVHLHTAFNPKLLHTSLGIIKSPESQNILNPWLPPRIFQTNTDTSTVRKISKSGNGKCISFSFPENMPQAKSLRTEKGRQHENTQSLLNNKGRIKHEI